jgi:hypothetical protein
MLEPGKRRKMQLQLQKKKLELDGVKVRQGV